MRDWVMKEYGAPATAEGARVWARVASTQPSDPITSAGQYVGVCRRLARRAMPPELGGPPWLEGMGRLDGRLVAVGFRRVPPSEWILGERRDGRPPRRLVDFVAWWTATQARPDVVGSDQNATPEAAFTLWAGGPLVRRAAQQVPSCDWDLLAGRYGSRLLRRNLRLAREIGRASSRASAREAQARISARALAALGRLCPEMQRAALHGAEERARARNSRIVRVRVCDMDWAAASAVQSEIAKGGARARLRLAYRVCEDKNGQGYIARRFRKLLASAAAGAGVTRAQYLAPVYPLVDEDAATRLFLGESPVAISGGELTRREAHEWLRDGGNTVPAAWLARYLDLGDVQVRSVAIARWLLAVEKRGGWGGLARERTVHGPAGAVMTVRYLDRVDEIQDTDLVRGAATSVEDAFRRAAERVGEGWLEKYRKDHKVLADTPEGWKLYPSMRVLNTAAKLVREGDELGHCVGGYAPAVESGQSVILSLNVAGHRSTAELTPAGKVLQHRARMNADPHPMCQRVLERFVERRINAVHR